MEIEFTREFWTALVQIIGIDLVLAGDNAIVIAMAAHALPRHMQRKVIIFGAFAAVALRVLLTGAVVVLLEVPLLKVVGGLLLVWIAYRLGTGDEGSHAERAAEVTTWRAAILTIIMADVVMSLDNVLAVAAAAEPAGGDSSFVLIGLGLLISIPIVMGGATILIRLIDRFPLLLWLGVALIAYTGTELVWADPHVHDVIAGTLFATTGVERFVSVTVALLVVLVGYLQTSRSAKESKLKVGGAPDDDEQAGSSAD